MVAYHIGRKYCRMPIGAFCNTFDLIILTDNRYCKHILVFFLSDRLGLRLVGLKLLKFQLYFEFLSSYFRAFKVEEMKSEIAARLTALERKMESKCKTLPFMYQWSLLSGLIHVIWDGPLDISMCHRIRFQIISCFSFCLWQMVYTLMKCGVRWT